MSFESKRGRREEKEKNHCIASGFVDLSNKKYDCMNSNINL
jgi:hypothetical protein